MRTIFWVIVFALALLEGVYCSTFTVPVLGMHEDGRADYALGSLKRCNSRSAAVDNIVYAISLVCPRGSPQPEEDDVFIYVKDKTYNSVMHRERHGIPMLYVSRGLVTDVNISDIKRDYEAGVLTKLPHMFPHGSIAYGINIGEHTNLLYIPEYGVLGPDDPTVIIYRMSDQGTNEINIRAYHDRENQEDSLYRLEDQVGYFINMRENDVEHVLESIKELYKNEVRVVDHHIGRYIMIDLGISGGPER